MPETITVYKNFSSDQTPISSINLSTATDLKITSLRGRGVAGARYFTTTGIQDDGVKINGLRLEPREMQLDLLYHASTESAALTAREKIAEYFHPFWDGLTAPSGSAVYPPGSALRIVRADSSTRQINFVTQGIVDMPLDSSSDFTGDYAGIVRASMFCAYPVWYDPTIETYTEASSNASHSSSFVADIDNTDWYMYPTIDITGPFSTFIIFDSENNSIQLSGTVSGGTTITIDLTPFDKKVVDQAGTDRADLLTTSTARLLESWKINPKWYHDTTTFTVSWSWTGGGSGTSVTMNYYKQHLYA